jgi:hypothetical protein
VGGPTAVPDAPAALSPIVRVVGGLPIQFLIRAAAFVVGATLLLIVDVRGVAFYLAWSLVVLGFVSEAAATFVFWRRSRAARRQGSG